MRRGLKIAYIPNLAEQLLFWLKKHWLSVKMTMAFLPLPPFHPSL